MSKKNKPLMSAKYEHNPTGVNLETLKRLNFSEEECISIALAVPSIEHVIEEAMEGDTTAAKRALALACSYTMNDRIAMPQALRRYLGNAFAKAAVGISADVAFNLKRNGRPSVPQQDKLTIGLWIYQAMQKGSTLQEASFDLQEVIEVNIEVNKNYYGYTKVPDSKTLEGIYCEVLPKIRQISEQVLKVVRGVTD
jgi:hypothetical protein